MYGAYYGTVPSIHKYIDTSQPLNGFGAAGDMLTIYEGVGALPSAPAKRGGCGCSKPALGRLAGFGTEILPDSAPPVGVTMGTNVQTALVALLVAGSAIAVGFAVAGGSKGSAMRANGRRSSRRGMRRNGRRAANDVAPVSHWGGASPPSGMGRTRAAAYKRGVKAAQRGAHAFLATCSRSAGKSAAWGRISSLADQAAKRAGEGEDFAQGFYSELGGIASKHGCFLSASRGRLPPPCRRVSSSRCSRRA